MTTITNKEREAAITKVLEATFTPLVTEFKDKLKAFIIADHAEKHPTFVALAAATDNRTYLKYSVSAEPHFVYQYECNGKEYTDHLKMKWPSYCYATAVSSTGQLLKGDLQTWGVPEIKVEDLLVCSSYTPVVTAELGAEYLALAAKRQAAYEELNKVFYSYVNREKFEADFPELARYLPKKPIKSKGTAVAIPVADFKATLLGLGIPPTETAA